MEKGSYKAEDDFDSLENVTLLGSLQTLDTNFNQHIPSTNLPWDFFGCAGVMVSAK